MKEIQLNKKKYINAIKESTQEDGVIVMVVTGKKTEYKGNSGYSGGGGMYGDRKILAYSLYGVLSKASDLLGLDLVMTVIHNFLEDAESGKKNCRTTMESRHSIEVE